MKHATPPTICSTCTQDVITLAENMGSNAIVSFCSHSAPDLVTFILCHQEHGVIRSWNLQGPMPFQDAQRYAARVAAIAPPARDTANPN